MVQMKVISILMRLTALSQVYIPHGSDESQRVYRGSNSKNEVYIPHGSDES